MPTNFPVSLRSWPVEDGSANSLSTLIGRINAERGNFREISEESLLKESQTAQLDDATMKDEGDSDTSEDDESTDRMKELMKARGDILLQIEQAHNTALIAQDFVSLLLSKDMPVQAGLSMSPLLKEAAGMGTLSADLTQGPRLTDAQRALNRETVKGWKVQSLNQTVDSILASATRLEKGIEAETKYWEQVLTIVGKGWDIARLPQERHTLGVRIGFAECTPPFRHRTLAALRSTADGSITLDQGLADQQAKRVRVRISTNGKITGQQTLPRAPANDANIEELILEARNTLFDEELWQEMNREARHLGNQGVCAKNGEIRCELTPTTTIIFDLFDLEDTGMGPGTSPHDKLADGISLAIHLLLTWNHRQSFRRRTQPPAPILPQKRSVPFSSLIRPLLTRLQFELAIDKLQDFIIPICNTLNQAGVSEAGYRLLSRSSLINPASLYASDKAISELVMDSLVTLLDSEIELSLTSRYKFTIKFRTSVIPYVMTQYKVESLADLSGEEWWPTGRVMAADDLRDYVLYISVCSLASQFLTPSSTREASSTDPVKEVEIETDTSAPGSSGWFKTTQGCVLRKTFAGTGQSRQLSFQLDSTMALHVECYELNGEGKETRRNEWVWQADQPSPQSANGKDLSVADVVEIAGTWRSLDIDTSMAEA